MIKISLYKILLIISLIKKTKIDLFGICAIIFVVTSKFILSIFDIDFSAIYYIISGAALGILIYGLIPKFKEKRSKKWSIYYFSSSF